jgi:hypothetical protein
MACINIDNATKIFEKCKDVNELRQCIKENEIYLVNEDIAMKNLFEMHKYAIDYNESVMYNIVLINDEQQFYDLWFQITPDGAVSIETDL